MKVHFRPIYTTVNFWHGSDKNGERTNFIRARTTYLQDPIEQE